MADKSLFILDAEARWRLAYDSNQWIIQRRKTLPRPSGVGGSAEPRWRAVSFIGSEKRVLHRCLREAGVVLTAEASARQRRPASMSRRDPGRRSVEGRGGRKTIGRPCV